ncbi:Molecular chaperone (DnaJ superfamily) [Ceraceosorus bombacis]|uniref:Diphthamide biosynthesis protein 4 n=1 Tax=Ceraceosorus bombacis TaxID=401625 RepID=A0A0P1BPW6_9BASI|nr:Molecular chaperone (DnaJ superfamily) [Ceraceosorus bombacis]
MSQRDEDFYKLLGVERGASSHDVRAAYLAQAKLNHPDRLATGRTSESDARIRALTHAYSVLSDPKSRIDYDIQLDHHHTLCNAASSKRAESRISAVIDIDAFELLEQEDADDLRPAAPRFAYPCRCGNRYAVRADRLEQAMDSTARDIATQGLLVQCGGCSLVVKVTWSEDEVHDKPD